MYVFTCSKRPGSRSEVTVKPISATGRNETF
jgi:hypothetical protein